MQLAAEQRTFDADDPAQGECIKDPVARTRASNVVTRRTVGRQIDDGARYGARYGAVGGLPSFT